MNYCRVAVYILWTNVILTSWTLSLCDSAAECKNLTKITPSDVLQISEGESGTLSCTAPCNNGSGIHNVYFIRPDNGPHKKNLSILDDPTLRQYLSEVNITSTTETCSYSLEIFWTEDKFIRREVDSLLCVFVYDSTQEFCGTSIVLVSFRDLDTGASTSESLRIQQPTHTPVSVNSSNDYLPHPQLPQRLVWKSER